MPTHKQGSVELDGPCFAAFFQLGIFQLSPLLWRVSQIVDPVRCRLFLLHHFDPVQVGMSLAQMHRDRTRKGRERFCHLAIIIQVPASARSWAE